MNRPSRALLVAAALASSTSACKKEQKAEPAAATQSATASAEAPEPPRAARVAPPDLDVASLQADLGCAGPKGLGACGVLARFAEAETWNMNMPSGEKRLLGKSYVVKKGKETEQLTLVHAQRVPTSKVGPGELAISVGDAPVPEDHIGPATKLYKRLARGDTPREGDSVLPYINEFEARNAILGGAKSKGTSIKLAGETELFIRQDGIKKILLVRLDIGPTASKGDGEYTEVWSVVW